MLVLSECASYKTSVGISAVSKDVVGLWIVVVVVVVIIISCLKGHVSPGELRLEYG